MATLSFLIAFAVAGGQITFAGAVATPTAARMPVVVQVSGTTAWQRVAVRTGRFDDPPRVVSVQPPGDDNTRTQIVVTYL